MGCFLASAQAVMLMSMGGINLLGKPSDQRLEVTVRFSYWFGFGAHKFPVVLFGMRAVYNPLYWFGGPLSDVSHFPFDDNDDITCTAPTTGSWF